MKKILKLILSLILTLSLICIALLDNVDSNVSADNLYTAIVDDNGNVVKYRNSNESILRLTEYDYPNQELRACWVSNFISSLPAYQNEDQWKEAYRHVLDQMEAYGLNCIIFHVRTHNNALYNSKLNPIATWFKDVNFEEFDPLAWSIEETHRRGMEFHAWLNPYRVNEYYCAEDYPEGNPASDESNLLSSGSSVILNPGIQANRDFIVDTCMEVVENYDVDAIHFDDYFYISGVETNKSADWKREQVNLFIEDLSSHLRTYNKEHQKTVQLGISPSGIYQNGSYNKTPQYNANGDLTSPLGSNTSGFAHYDNYLYSDTLHWINEEWIDYIMPQTYWSLEHTSASFGALSRWWSWAVAKKKVNLYLGMGIYMPVSGGSSGTYWQKNKYEVRDQILNGSMYEEVGGFSFYSYNYLTDTNKYISTGMDIVKNDYWTAKIPCDVKKYYADQYDTITPKNFFLTNNILNLELSDQIRGYIVYKVHHTKSFNPNDVSQIYYYGNDEKVTLDDMEEYSYYLATVNLANEISDAVLATASNIGSKYVIKQIAALPSVIKVELESKLNLILDAYNVLSDQEKAEVTNLQVLLDAIEIVEKKKIAIEELNDYVILNLYSLSNQTVLTNLITDYTNQIDEVVDILEIDSLVVTFKNEVDKIPTSNLELQNAINNALRELDEFYQALDKTYYTKQNIDSINQIYNDAIAKIKRNTDTETIKNIVNSAKTRINAIKSFKTDYENALTSIELNLNNHLLELLATKEWLNLYQAQTTSIISSLLDEAKALDKETLITTLDAYIVTVIAALDDELVVFETIHNAITTAITEINAYENNIELKNTYIDKINQAQTIEEVNRLLNEFKTKYQEAQQNSSNNNPENDKKCSLFSSIMLIELLSAFSLAYLVIRKKH